MKAKDIMTSPVVSIEPDTPVRAIAALLFEHRISAVPVLEDGRLVGIVSEADLLHRHEIGTDGLAQPGSWWRRLFSVERSIEDYIKSHACRAGDVMSREVASVTPETPVSEVVKLLDERNIRRVPVLDDGRLVGIVSRSNLVRALAEIPGTAPAAAQPDDETILARLLAELQSQAWWLRGMSNVEVSEGVAIFYGVIDSEQERDAARVAAENVPGVRRIEDERVVYRDLPSMV